MNIEINRTDKLPRWFKIIIGILVAALVVTLLYNYFKTMAEKTEQGYAKKRAIQAQIDSHNVQTAAADSGQISSAKTASENANKITKKITHHEKTIVSDPGIDSIARFIAEYKYTE